MVGGWSTEVGRWSEGGRLGLRRLLGFLGGVATISRVATRAFRALARLMVREMWRTRVLGLRRSLLSAVKRGGKGAGVCEAGGRLGL
ncbi:hypothetical protein U1Q18_030894 [Sarracenia purpurea var. burkii]